MALYYIMRTLLSIVNIIFHLTGAYILIHLYRNGHKTPQKIYLVNLSLIEIVKNLLLITYDILVCMNYFHFHEYAIHVVVPYLTIIYENGVAYHYYIAMFLLTLDRLLATVLNIKYPIYWKPRRAMVIIFCVTTFNVIMCSGTLISYVLLGEEKFKTYGIRKILTTYVAITLNLVFIALAISTYSYMFYTHIRSQRYFTDIDDVTSHVTAFSIFRRTKFFVSILIIISFIVFTVLPDLIFGIHGVRTNNKHISYAFRVYLLISFSLSDTVDSVIYIFLQKSVRDVLFTKLECFRRRNEEDQIIHVVSDERKSRKITETTIL